MEFTSVELKVIEVAVEEAKADDARTLDQLHLVLLGGGVGDVVF